MRPDLDNLVPGLAEARSRENEARAIAFLNSTELLLGVEVRPLTLRAYFELIESGNPIVVGGLGNHRAIVAFLWRVSPRFCRPGTFRWALTKRFRRQLARHVRTIDPIKASDVLSRWMTEQNQDQPPRVESDSDKPKSNDSPGFYWIASLIDFFAEKYGWNEDETLDRPMMRLWQLYRANARRNGVEIPSMPPSDRLRREWVTKMLNEQSRAAASAILNKI